MLEDKDCAKSFWTGTEGIYPKKKKHMEINMESNKEIIRNKMDLFRTKHGFFKL